MMNIRDFPHPHVKVWVDGGVGGWVVFLPSAQPPIRPYQAPPEQNSAGFSDSNMIDYPFHEFCAMVVRRFSRPQPLNGQPAAVDVTVEANRNPTHWIGFVGDISPLAGREARYEQDVVDFFDGCDVMVGNLEGVITERRWRPYRHNHTPVVVDALRPLGPPDQWILSVANNHAADYGDADLYNTVACLEQEGMHCLGTRERPRIDLLPGVTLTTWTCWLNRPTTAVPLQDPGAPATRGLHIAYPHWGFEHERVPRIDQALPEGYPLVVGHHSHLPQPFEQRDGVLVAWSLGNLLTHKRLPVLGEGALLKVGLAPNAEGVPEVVRAHFRLIHLDRGDARFCRVHFRNATSTQAEVKKLRFALSD